MAYNGSRKRNLFDPLSSEPFKLSRSKIELFLQCPKCFYLDRRLGVSQPPGYPFTLNSAVDALLKKEFDIYRTEETSHPLMEQYGIDAVPFLHPKMDEWRENFKGVQYFDEESNFIVTGAVDDIWMNPEGELIVVDYKATSTENEITLDADYRQGYKRQMEIYQWLLRKNEFTVSPTGYFVYANGRKDRKAFDGRLEFEVQIIPYEGNDSWVSGTLLQVRKCLEGDIAKSAELCEFCKYRREAGKHEVK